MNILLLGGGGREHALGWRLAQSLLCDTLYAAPGNPGIAAIAQCVTLDVTDHSAVVDFCAEHAIGLIVIGPEAPLVDGLADTLRSAGLPVFGPGARAAQLEGSKSFTKDICSYAAIPTARYEHYPTLAEAKAGLSDFALPAVIKANGLAAGKGVVIAATTQEALEALDDMFGGTFGSAGASVIIEEFMDGEEVSFFALTDGVTIIPFGSAQDHKRAGEGDTGKNTGGMGAYSPASVFTPAVQTTVMRHIIEPTVAAMAQANMPYCGVLFAGLMLTAEGPKLIEYNCRFGDPEAQVLMMRFTGDLAALLFAVATTTLAQAQVPEFSSDAALTVVIAARGYPDAPLLGGIVSAIPANTPATMTFHAGTTRSGAVVTACGGRVLSVTARGHDVTAARDAAYAIVQAIAFPDGVYRSDIGWREIARERTNAKTH